MSKGKGVRNLFSVAMAPPSEAHGTIVANLTGELRNRLTPPCSAVGEAGVSPTDRNDTYYQADLLVTCSPPQRGRAYPEQPVPSVELLSPSTELHDRGRKVEPYSSCPRRKGDPNTTGGIR